MKILFLLFAFTVSFVFYIAPTLIFQYISRKKWHRQILRIDLSKKKDVLLIFTPFALWFVLYIFDPTQKTVRQTVFVDTVIIGTMLLLTLVARHHLGKKQNPAKFTYFSIIFVSIAAVLCWFLIPPTA